MPPSQQLFRPVFSALAAGESHLAASGSPDAWLLAAPGLSTSAASAQGQSSKAANHGRGRGFWVPEEAHFVDVGSWVRIDSEESCQEEAALDPLFCRLREAPRVRVKVRVRVRGVPGMPWACWSQIPGSALLLVDSSTACGAQGSHRWRRSPRRLWGPMCPQNTADPRRRSAPPWPGLTLPGHVVVVLPTVGALLSTPINVYL